MVFVSIMTKFVDPAFNLSAFTCPHCGVLAQQVWERVFGESVDDETYPIDGINFNFCLNNDCKGICIWLNQELVYPLGSLAPLPHDEMPDDVKNDYLEARLVVGLSPRSAAALLRLALQKLMKHLGEPGKNINDDIKNLVKKGLPVGIQKAFDSLRVYGNEAVHPEEIDLTNDSKTVLKLFGLMNLIVYHMIIAPMEIEELFEGIPQEKKDGIIVRDCK